MCVFVCVCACNTEQLEAFKKHMEAGETNTPAIIMGEENEDDTENGQLPNTLYAFTWEIRDCTFILDVLRFKSGLDVCVI